MFQPKTLLFATAAIAGFGVFLGYQYVRRHGADNVKRALADAINNRFDGIDVL